MSGSTTPSLSISENRSFDKNHSSSTEEAKEKKLKPRIATGSKLGKTSGSPKSLSSLSGSGGFGGSSGFFSSAFS